MRRRAPTSITRPVAGTIDGATALRRPSEHKAERTGRPLRLAAALLPLLLAACDGTGLRAGGEYSGFPDIPMGGPNMVNQYGHMDIDGTVHLKRDRYYR
jgi:hypothetical protein